MPRTAPAKRGRKPVLSPTRINTYLECAVKYRYIYLDKIGRYYLRARSYYSFGSTLHQVLQGFHESGGEQSSDEMAQALHAGWIDAGYQSAEQEAEHLAAGEQIVRAYHAGYAERETQQIETIATEKSIRFDMGPFVLAGRVDRIDRHPDGLLEIIDYKSGRMEVTPEEIAADLAMSCYQLILRRLFPAQQVTATIYCLRNGATATYRMSDS
ncbi:MAG TPA: PD-(D/E)XK nuclease family protein, partial [Chthonomonadales bacterium]|nr:PD-(D/E)XK nuclease family protein [Chthonomonadales bacterium]